MDNNVTIADLKATVDKFIVERDWKQFHNPQDIAVSISIESAELLEVFQWAIKKEMPPEKIEMIKDEISDIMIYLMSMANSLNFDLSEAVTAKITKNAKKYPVEKAKGNAKKYTELI